MPALDIGGPHLVVGRSHTVELERRHANSGRSTDRPSRNLPDARSSADHPLPLREGANGWQGCTRVGSKMVVTSVGNAVGKRLAMVCLAGSRKDRTVGTAVGKPEFQLKVGNSTVGNGLWQLARGFEAISEARG